MDDKTFDSLIRTAGTRNSRRAALKGLVGGFLGFGVARGVAGAQVEAEACRIQRCKKQVLDQPCTDSRGNPDNHKCCQGLKCDNRKGRCVYKNGHGGAGDYCDVRDDCLRDFFCKKNQCVPDSCG